MPEGRTGWDETENSYRYRLRDPDDFKKDSYRTIKLKGVKGISMVMGRLKGENTLTPQSVVFSKKEWTKDEAKKWMDDHRKSLLSKSIEAPIDFTMKVQTLNKDEAEESDDIFFEGIASTEGIDLTGDIVDAQALQESLKGYLINGPVLYQHQEDKPPIARIVEAKITPKGLYVKGKFSQATQFAKELAQQFKEGLINFGLSVSGFVKDRIEEIKDGRRVSRIYLSRLREISITPFPANPETYVTLAKALKVLMDKDDILLQGGEFMMDGDENIEEKEEVTKEEDQKTETLIKRVVSSLLRAINKTEDEDSSEEAEDPDSLDKALSSLGEASESISKAGKRISKETEEKIKAIISTLNSLIGEIEEEKSEVSKDESNAEIVAEFDMKAVFKDIFEEKDKEIMEKVGSLVQKKIDSAIKALKSEIDPSEAIKSLEDKIDNTDKAMQDMSPVFEYVVKSLRSGLKTDNIEPPEKEEKNIWAGLLDFK